jgi:hypothetical protein
MSKSCEDQVSSEVCLRSSTRPKSVVVNPFDARRCFHNPNSVINSRNETKQASMMCAMKATSDTTKLITIVI